MNKKIIISVVIIIAVIFTLLMYYRTTPIYLIKKDINLFNSLTSENLDIEICWTIKNQEIREKCSDNFYSLNAFKNTDESICNKIIDYSLKELCKKEILKFVK